MPLLFEDLITLQLDCMDKAISILTSSRKDSLVCENKIVFNGFHVYKDRLGAGIDVINKERAIKYEPEIQKFI